ncbi:MAG: hypothetical protein HY749_16150 [Gammaproteobacteria bacterium]|nr:hypothetical protein [Gammaproteobacteria bacterium]
MKAEYLLTRAAGGICGYEAQIPGTNQTVKFTTADVGHALAGAHWYERDLVLLKWAMTPQNINALARSALARVQRSGVELPPRGGARLILVARGALAEVVSATLCGKCAGLGFTVPTEHKREVCESCAGLGVGPWSSRQRAAELKIPRETFRRSWSKPYDELRRTFIADETNALTLMYHHLRNRL